jgi:hypothetical protein
VKALSPWLLKQIKLLLGEFMTVIIDYCWSLCRLMG